MKTPRGPTLFDASVVIDYAQADAAVLGSICAHVGPVHIPSPVMGEVEPELDAASAMALGLIPVEPTLPQAAEASQRGGPLSFQDKLCFAMARDRAWLLVTNDRALRRRCVQEGVPVDWGLNPMLWLVQGGHMRPRRALGVARAIQRDNPYVTSGIVARFAKKLTTP